MPPTPDPAGARLALVIGTATYTDPGFRQLRAPAQDVADMVEVLSDPAIGGFTVTPMLDRAEYEIRRAIDGFLAGRRVDDLVVVYLSSHGVLDARGRLYFAATNTVKSQLSSTGVESAWLLEQLEHCRARRQVLILDCCFSGSFAHTKGDTEVDLERRLVGAGRGRAVLTASRAEEYSYEGTPLPGASGGSVFTAGLVDGLRSGDADRDGDGYITVEEAYSYAADQVKERGGAQRPQRWLYSAEGAIILARNPRGATPAVLSESLQLSLDSPYPDIRHAAVTTLGAWLTSTDRGRILAAQQALHRVASHDSPTIAAAARDLLHQTNPPVPPGSGRVSDPPPRHPQPTRSTSAPAAPSAVPQRLVRIRKTSWWKTNNANRKPILDALAIFVRNPFGYLSTNLNKKIPFLHLYRKPIIILLVAALIVVGTALLAGNSLLQLAGLRHPTIAVASYPTGVAVSPDGRRVYVTGYRGVSVIDTSSDAVTATIAVGHSPNKVAVSPDGRRLYLTHYSYGDRGSGRVSVIDTSSGAVTATIAVGDNPEGVAVSPDGRHIYLTHSEAEHDDRGSGRVSVIDTSSEAVTAKIAIGDNPEGVAVSPDGRRVYVAGYSGVSVIDTSSEAVTAKIAISNSSEGVAVSPDGRRVYVTGYSEVSVIDTSSEAVAAPITVGDNAYRVAVSPDGRRLYVTHYGYGDRVRSTDTVSVIDTTRDTVTATITVGDNPREVAVSPDGHHVYVIHDDGVSSIDLGA